MVGVQLKACLLILYFMMTSEAVKFEIKIKILDY